MATDGFWYILVTVFKRSLNDFIVGAEKDRSLDNFVNWLLQPLAKANSTSERSSLIEYLVPFLETWAVVHTTLLTRRDMAIQQMGLRADFLHRCWQSNRLCMKALESVVQTWSEYHASVEGLSSTTEALLREYSILFQRSRDQSQDITAYIQQTSALESIRESQKAFQSADSVRR